jgi:quercetin dioxygenase-like cupin family protein
MSYLAGDVALARAPDNETLRNGQNATRLLLDGSDTGGAMNVIRSQLAVGASGPGPHLHKGFSEMLYVVSGELQVLAGETVTTLLAGDVAVVPPGLPHAFAAGEGSAAEALLVMAPGIDRFEYFRQMTAMASFPPPEEFQEQFDNWFLHSEVWQQRSVWDRSGA